MGSKPGQGGLPDRVEGETAGLGQGGLPARVTQGGEDPAGAALLRRKEEAKAALAEILISKAELLDGVKALAQKFPGEMEVFESDTNFVFIRTERYLVIFQYMLEKGIAIRKFTGYLRITAGSREENRAVLNVLEEFFTK